jgi:hypothetical protein
MKILYIILASCSVCAQDFIPFLGGASSPGNNLTPDLVAQYKYDEIGGVAVDSVGALDLTDGDSSGSNAGGKINRARILDPANDDFFYHADNAAFEIGNGDYTMAFWVKFGTAPTDGDFQTVLTKWDIVAGTGSWFIDAIQDSGLGSGFEIGASIDGSNVGANNPRVVMFEEDGITPILLVAGQWYFVCARFDASAETYELIVYDEAGRRFNDARELTGLSTSGVFDGTESLMVGGFSATATTINPGQAISANSLIDEMGFWSRYLSDCEVSKLASPVAKDDYNSTTCVE